MQIQFKASFFLFIIIISLIHCKSNFHYKKPPNKLIDVYLEHENLLIPKQAIFAETYLPLNFSKNGKVDYTHYLQKALNENKYLIFPNFPILINREGLTIKSNTTLFFQKNSLIKYSGPANGKYWDIIKIFNVENINILNAKIEGSRYSSKSQSGEWSAGISIRDSKNIIVKNSRIKDTYGDGIFIGSEDGKYSSDIQIIGGWIDNVRRNGISITSGKNVIIKHVLISNTNGTLPSCGIDIEPSIYEDIIENISIVNFYTFNNEVSGVAINLNALNSQLEHKRKFVTIQFSNHIDEHSAYAFSTSLNMGSKGYDADGTITFKDSHWFQNRSGSYWKSSTDQKLKISFKNIKSDDNSLQYFLKKQKNFSVE